MRNLQARIPCKTPYKLPTQKARLNAKLAPLIFGLEMDGRMSCLKPVFMALLGSICIQGLLIFPGDLNAEDLVQVTHEAQDSAPLFQSYGATNQAAEQGYYAAVGSLFPTIALSATDNAVAYNADGYGDQYLSNVVAVTLTQPIFNLNLWGASLNQADLADLARVTYEANVQSFYLTVSTDYFNILQDQDVLLSDKAAVDFYSQTLKQTQEKFQAGLSTIKDVKQAEADYDLSYATEIKDQSQLQIDISELQKLTGRRLSRLAFPEENFPFAPPDPQDINYWVSQAVSNNKALEAARYQAEATKQTITENIGNQLPQVNFVGTYGTTNTNARHRALINNFANQSNSHAWAVQLVATWSIFAGTTGFASSIQATKNYEAQTDTALQTYRDTQAKTRQDYRAVLSDTSQVAALKQAVHADELSLKQLDEEYKVGTETIVNVLDQAHQLFADRRTYAAAEYQYMTDSLTLYQDVGSLGLPQITALNQWLTLSRA